MRTVDASCRGLFLTGGTKSHDDHSWGKADGGGGTEQATTCVRVLLLRAAHMCVCLRTCARVCQRVCVCVCVCVCVYKVSGGRVVS